MPAINQHLKRVFSDNELEEDAVVKSYLITAADGKNCQTKHYSLQAIIAIGFKIENKRAVQFRKWANQIVTDHTRHGLGLKNLLLIAAELLLLSQSDETGLPLLPVEEPESHLHPQLQLRLMEFREEKAIASGVQAVLTTHSPNLASKAKLADDSIVDHCI